MARIIAIANQKGGVGKTTTAINFAASLAAAEFKILVLDLDPQGNATSGLGIAKTEIEKNLYHAFLGEVGLPEIILPTELPTLFVAPSNQDLIGLEVEFMAQQGREYFLKELLGQLDASFDYVLIDCPPSLGLLTLNALCAAHSVLLPLQCEYYALEGLSSLMHTIELVRGGLNPDLSLEGILLTMFDTRNNLCRQVAQDVQNHFGSQVFSTVIPRNVRLSESPSHGKPILLYDIHSSGARSYLALAKEFLQQHAERPQAAKPY